MSINPSTPDPINRCVRVKRNGERCKRLANNGMTVCNSHGGRAPQVRAKAQLRLAMAADDLMGALLRIAMNEKLPAQHRLVAIRDGLDRANLGAKAQIELDISTDRKKTFDELVEQTLVEVAETDDGEWFVQYADGTAKVMPADRTGGYVGSNSMDVLMDIDMRSTEDVIDAEVIEDDHTPLVPRDDDEPLAQTRSDRAFTAELERAQQRGRPDARSVAERNRMEVEEAAALGLTPASSDTAVRLPDRGTIGREVYLTVLDAGGSHAEAEAAARAAAEGGIDTERRRARSTEATFSEDRRPRRRR